MKNPAVPFYYVYLAELKKLCSLPLITITSTLLVIVGWFLPAGLVLVARQLGEDPAGAASQTINLLEIGAILIGAAATGSEYANRQIQTSLLSVPNRTRFLTAKLVAVTIWVTVAGIVAILGGAISTSRTASMVGNPIPFSPQLGITTGGVAYLIAMTLLATFTAFITRSQAATVTVLLVLFEIVVPMFLQYLPALAWLPNHAGHRLFALTTWQGTVQVRSLGIATAVVALWLLISGLVATFTFRHRDLN